jgi:hypothetical protein
MSADEVESEASNDGHVLSSVSLSVSGEIVLELDIEDPVHALDAPVTADGGGDFVDVAGHGGDVGSDLVSDLASVFGCGVDLGQGGYAREAGLAWIAAVRSDPRDVVGGDIAPGLYASMALFEGRGGDDLGGGRRLKVFKGIGFQGRLIALEGQNLWNHTPPSTSNRR